MAKGVTDPPPTAVNVVAAKKPEVVVKNRTPSRKRDKENSVKTRATATGNDTASQKTTLVNADSDTVTNIHRLRRDGFKTPAEFRQVAYRVQSPSELSVELCTQHYKIPDGKFRNARDVYKYRGYTKIGKIDEGAFGIVSKARRNFDGKLFAVKEVDLSKKRAKRIQEMRRELFVLQRVEHKHIVQLIEHFVIGNSLVIIMELCEGNNLTSYLKASPLSEGQTLFYFKQMAVALKTLHRRGIAHRDVKLNNFLLDGSGKLVKISDFGLSVVGWRKGKGLLTAHTYCGTEPYMAPEILRRNANSMRSYNPFYADLWSLGICLFAMLTQTFPFKITTNHENLLKAQVSRQWKFPRSLRSNISEDLKDLCWHLLDPEPGRRITINDTLLHPWLNSNFSTMSKQSKNSKRNQKKSSRQQPVQPINNQQTPAPSPQPQLQTPGQQNLPIQYQQQTPGRNIETQQQVQLQIQVLPPMASGISLPQNVVTPGMKSPTHGVVVVPPFARNNMLSRPNL